MRLFQINENDLNELERVLPELIEALEPSMANRHRVQARRVKQIISDVRWSYGPASECEAIAAEEE